MDVQTQISELGWSWNRGCKVCGKRGDLKKCTKCNNVYYCSKECQKLDFKQHKQNCIKDKHILKLLPKEDPKNPCPICLCEECDEGMFATCYQCGASFCGNCIAAKYLATMNGCPMCRHNQNFSDDKKLECLEKLLQRGVPIEQVYPSIALVRIRKNPSDPSIIVYLTRALDKGANYAGFKLAEVLEDQGGDKNMIFELHQQAASHRIYLSQTWLANHYLSKGNKEVGIHWHTRAYENGSLESTKWLADYFFEEGDDEPKAIELYKQAGGNGCSDSIFTYAKIMEEKGNKQEAHKNYIKCMLFVPEAYYRLGEMYSTGYPSLSLSNALSMYTAGADNGNVNCLTKLGLIFLSFSDDNSDLKQILIDADPDYEQKFVSSGLKYLNQAMELGSSKAAIYLGDYYLTNKNINQTIEMYQKAFDLGDPEAYVSMARIYTYGERVPKDTVKALMYLGKAMEAGSQEAEETLKIIMEKVGQPSDDLSSVP